MLDEINIDYFSLGQLKIRAFSKLFQSLAGTLQSQFEMS